MVIMGKGGLTCEPGCVTTSWGPAVSGKEGVDHRICSRVQMRTDAFFLSPLSLLSLGVYLPLFSCQLLAAFWKLQAL